MKEAIRRVQELRAWQEKLKAHLEKESQGELKRLNIQLAK
jgi:hypothetical protein